MFIVENIALIIGVKSYTYMYVTALEIIIILI